MVEVAGGGKPPTWTSMQPAIRAPTRRMAAKAKESRIASDARGGDLSLEAALPDSADRSLRTAGGGPRPPHSWPATAGSGRRPRGVQGGAAPPVLMLTLKRVRPPASAARRRADRVSEHEVEAHALALLRLLARGRAEDLAGLDAGDDEHRADRAVEVGVDGGAPDDAGVLVDAVVALLDDRLGLGQGHVLAADDVDEGARGVRDVDVQQRGVQGLEHGVAGSVLGVRLTHADHRDAAA